MLCALKSGARKLETTNDLLPRGADKATVIGTYDNIMICETWLKE